MAALVWFQGGARAPAPDPVPDIDASGKPLTDVELYRAIIARVRAGEPYYDVAGSELRGRGYPVRPLFNWRQPTYAWLLARMPHPYCANLLMAVLGAVVLALAHRWMIAAAGHLRGRRAALLVGVAMSGALVPVYVLFQETWAATLIVLSMCFYARDRWRPGVAAALAALAFREFALLPCALGLLLALRRRRWPEVAAWVGGLALYAALFAWHVHEITRRLQPDDLSRGWVAFGGSAFLVSAGRWSPLAILLPRWAIALVLPLSFFGLAGWRNPTGTRIALVAGGYLVAFSVLGNPCNNYWGMMFAPLLFPFGLPWLPASARELWRVLVTARPAPALTTASPT